jgi:hypothetical protein
VVASDGTLSDSQAVVVTVNDVNEAPVISSAGSATIDENAATTTAVYTAAASDPDAGATITYSLTGEHADKFEISASGVVTLKESADYETLSTYNITVVASDGTLSDSQAVVVTVNNVNEAPNIPYYSATPIVYENQPVGTVVPWGGSATDPDGDDLTFRLVGADAGSFQIDSTTGAIVTRAVFDYETKAVYVFQVVVNDGELDSFAREVRVQIWNTNDAPTFASPSGTGSIAENAATSTVIYDANASDVDSGSLTYTVTGTHADKVNINSANGQVTLKSSANFEAFPSLKTYSFTVVANDGSLSASQAVTVNVTDVNEAPWFSSGTGAGTVRENAATSTVIYDANATDVDAGDSITYSVTGGDAGRVNINSSSGEVTLKNSADYEVKSSYSFYVRATDSKGLIGQQLVTIAVTNVVDETAPTATIGTQGYAQVKLEAPGYSSLDDRFSSILQVNDRGEYVVSWMGYTDSGASQYRVWLQHFNSDGTTQGSASELAPAGTIARGSAFGDTHARMARVSATGNYAVTWLDRESAGADKSSVYVQLFKEDGTKISDPYKIEAATDSEDVDPQVAAVGYDTQFAVVYTGDVGATETVYLQHFYSTGAPKGGLITVSSGLAKSYRPEITAINDRGDYVVVFTGQEVGDASGDFAIYYQRYTYLGVKSGELQKFEPTGYPSGFNGRPEIAALGDDGAFAFVWHGQGASGYQNIYVRKVTSAGVLQSQIELSAKGTTLAEDQLPKVLNVGDGEAFVVVWEGKEGANPGADSSVYTQLFDGNGNPSGAMVKLEGEVGNGDDQYIQVARYGASGEYVVAWQGPDSGGDSSIYVQLFNSNGTTKGSRIKLEGDGRTDGNDYLPQITTAGGAGGFAVSWHGTDGNGDNSVFVQQFYQDGSMVQPLAVGSGGVVTVRSSEVGTIYLVHEIVDVTDLESITGIRFGYLWKAAAVTTANSDVTISTGGLAGGHYSVYSVDSTGNLSRAADYGVDVLDPRIVVFDLVRGVSSNHTGRNFSAALSYDIYIRVDSDGAQLPELGADWHRWGNANNLGADDTIILVGSGGEILGSRDGAVDEVAASAGAVEWLTSGIGRAARLTRGGKFSRSYDGGAYVDSHQFSADLWGSNWGANPNSGETLGAVLMTALPAGFLTSQGLT